MELFQLTTQFGHTPVQCSISQENGDAAGFADFFMRSAAAGCYAPWVYSDSR